MFQAVQGSRHVLPLNPPSCYVIVMRLYSLQRFFQERRNQNTSLILGFVVHSVVFKVFYPVRRTFVMYLSSVFLLEERNAFLLAFLSSRS